MDDLLKKQRELLDQLKLRNAKLYNWLLEHKDFSYLGKYAANLTASIALLTSPPTPTSLPAPLTTVSQALSTNQFDTSVIPLRSADLRGLSDTERGNLVWSRYGNLIRASAQKYAVDPNLLFATIMIESGGDTYAVREEPRINDASYGLGQLLYGTARGLGYKGTPSGLFDPAVNIDLIAKYHRLHLDQAKRPLTAEELTIAYNTGSVDKKPLPGHLTKFLKWYNRAENLEVNV